jgi:branched-chain amino acid aminotransferase
MNALVSIDGRIVPAGEASVSVLDRGFLYGDSVFEALRTYGRVPFALGEHLARLEESARRALIELPVTRPELEQEIIGVLAAADQKESLIRVMLSRGSAETLGLDPGLARGPLRVVLVVELSDLPSELYERGIGVITYPTERVGDATRAAGAKLANYLVAVLAMREAKQKRAEEAIVLNHKGQVAEGCTSNVFLVKGGRLVTPSRGLGILLGITRAHVLDLARQAGISCEESVFTTEELLRADEAFITSSIREVVPVVRVDGHAIGVGVPGPVTERLLDAYRRLTRGG